MFFDAHNHIHGTIAEGCFKQLLARAQEHKVRRMHACATGAPGDWPLMQKALEEAPSIIGGSFGVHPWYCGCEPANWKRELEGLLDRYNAAVGEVGLDASAKAPCPISEQVPNLCWQMDLALERKLPLTLHCVKGWAELTRELRARPSLRWMLHATTARPEQLRELLALGGCFSYGSALLDPHRPRIADSLRMTPPERLLLETDSPDGWKGSPALEGVMPGPERLPELCAAAARILQVSEAELAAITRENAEKFFRLCQ